MPILVGEAVKLATLPSTWIASALTVALPPALAYANGSMLNRALTSGRTGGLLSTSTIDEGFGQLTFGVVGIVILGVLAISSEYARNAQAVGGGRQISTTMTATPGRLATLAAKLAVLFAWVVGLVSVTIPLTLLASAGSLGNHATDFGSTLLPRAMGVGLYWVTMSMLAFALAAITRSGVMPLVLLLTNASIVSFSLLAAQVTELARYLPDIAAYSTFLTESPVATPLGAGDAWIACALWAGASALLAAWAYVRRDA